MYGSSYPHWSTSPPDVAASGLDAAQCDKVLWQNASELYGLEAKGLAAKGLGAKGLAAKGPGAKGLAAKETAR
jgi:hypothetical protein